jgi:hypothetical protein
VSKLPDVPKFFLAGNHEQYGNEEWKAITGNDRSGTITLGNNTFVLLDACAGDLNPTTRKPMSSKAYNRKRTQAWKKELPDLRPLYI